MSKRINYERETRKMRIISLYEKYFDEEGKFLQLSLPNGSEIELFYRHHVIPLLQRVEVFYRKVEEKKIVKIFFVEPEVMKLFNFLDSEDFEEKYETVKSNLENGFFVFPVFLNRRGWLKIFVFSGKEFKLFGWKLKDKKENKKVDLEKPDKEVIFYQAEPFFFDFSALEKESEKVDR
jgi:hypothetical protein